MDAATETPVDKAPEGEGEWKQHVTLTAESVPVNAATFDFEHEHSVDTVHPQSATSQCIHELSKGSHPSLASTELSSSDFSIGSTAACSALHSEENVDIDITSDLSERVLCLQETKKCSYTYSELIPEGLTDIPSIDIEPKWHQGVEKGLCKIVERGLHPEVEQRLNHEIHQEQQQKVDQRLHQKADQGPDQEFDQQVHLEVEKRLPQEARLSEVHKINDSRGMSEINKDDSPVFIGPVLPTGHELQSQGVCEDASIAGDDMVMDFSHYSPGHVSVADDFRYNLTVTSVPRMAASAGWEFQKVDENFLRGCKWSPDGSCVLTNSNDNCLRIFSSFEKTDTSKFIDNQQMTASVKMKECSLVYDFAWHPKMNLSQAEHCRVACTCSGIPIHLWDATTGQIVANYRAYDQFDEITAAYSLSFSLDGKKIYAGYNKAIRIFDTDYPVRSCKNVTTYSSQRKDGQTGIISSFAFSPNENGLYVAGSYSRHIGMYDSACDKLVCLMQGQHGGVTHLMFSPDATKLYSGGRKDAEILCWDIRNMDKILFSALRDVKTNQRMYFDLSQSGRYLVSGNNDGTVAFWDTLSPIEEINGDAFLKPCSQFQAHGDCVNGVSFNHHKNMLATASGQRHFQNFDYDSSDSAEDEKMEAADMPDFSLRLWQIPLLS